MRVIIAGPRDYTNAKELEKAIKKSKYNITMVVSGGALGVDTMGEAWATKNKKPIVRFPAQWEAFGKAAGAMRNALMAEFGEALIAISAGSRGTDDMIKQMKKAKKPVFTYTPTDA